ncbi:MAG: XRE family transcriptional regulator [Erysipelothrix sp.]|nr:XRE family transcriptional regulator [Erysipelothrix sp.]
MATFGERLRECRKVAKLTQKDLAHAAQVAESTISMYEMEKRQPDFETLEVLADVFNVDIDYLLGRTDCITVIPNSRVTSMVTKIPVYGKISAGKPFEAIEEILDHIEVPSWLANRTNLFGLMVVGDSMNKVIPNGYIAVIQKTSSLDDGCIGAIMVGGSDATLKRYYTISDGIVLEALSFNPEHKDLIIKKDDHIEVTIIGKLVWSCAAKSF